MRLARRNIGWLVVIMLVIGCLASPVDACPNCKNSLQANHHALGYALSILFLMGMPFTIFSGWVLVIWRLRGRGDEAPSSSETP